MSEVGERMIRELQAIRKALEGSQPLGFGKKTQPVYVFVKHSPESLWYSRDKAVGENVAISERDLTGYLVNVWRYERLDEAAGEVVPKLNLQVKADQDYVIQSGFSTNFARTFLAGVLELESSALKEPLTLVLEDNTGSKARPTVFCRVESRGVRMTPTLNRETRAEELYREVVTKFGFGDPYAVEESGRGKR